METHSTSEPKKKSFGQKDLVLFILAVLAFSADIVTLIQFTVSKIILDFFSFNWIIGIIFIVGFFLVGLIFLRIAKYEDKEDSFKIAFGAIYSLMSLGIFSFLGYYHIFGEGNFNSFVGLFLLLMVFLIIAVYGLTSFKEFKFLKIPSYVFAISNFAIAGMMVVKYLHLKESFSFFPFFGELIIIVIGALIFYNFYDSSKTNLNSFFTYFSPVAPLNNRRPIENMFKHKKIFKVDTESESILRPVSKVEVIEKNNMP